MSQAKDNGNRAGDARPSTDGAFLELRLADGRRLLAPRDLIRTLPDGRLQIACDTSVADTTNAAGRFSEAKPSLSPDRQNHESIVVPVVEERLDVGRRAVVTGKVRVTTHTDTHEEVVDVPLEVERAEVERVAIGREVDRVPEVRQEGGTYIIPVVEEVLEVRKKLVLREEVRLTLRRDSVHQPQRVSLRRQEATIEKMPAENLNNPA